MGIGSDQSRMGNEKGSRNENASRVSGRLGEEWECKIESRNGRRGTFIKEEWDRGAWKTRMGSSKRN
jgi:hypothetical protein